MWLFFQDVDEFATGGYDPIKGAEALGKAGLEGVNFMKQMEVLTSMEAKALSIQKIIGSGIVNNTEAFREKITSVYIETSKVGATFKDVTDLISGLYTGLGRMVEPSEDVTTRMVFLSKATGVASESLGKMVSDFMNLTFSQEKSADAIEKITDLARRGGVNVKATLESVQKNLDKVSAYGFKNGIDGLAKMAVQAQQLRTTVEEIGAVQMGQTFWDPEKAIEAAAGMSMLGGSMSNLMNPFQLMNMGANNVEKLQESLIDLSASAYKVNETTGEVETNFVAQQRLKEQLTALGKGNEYEKFINLGREAAKQAKIIADINKSGLGTLFEGEGKTFTEEDQRLIASLSEVKDGKISLKIPGFDQIDNLQDALTGNPERIKDALQKYQDAANQSEKDIATKSLSTQEQQTIDLRVIRETLIRSSIIGEEGRKDMIALSESLQKKESGTIKTTSGSAVEGIEVLKQFYDREFQNIDANREDSDEMRAKRAKKTIQGPTYKTDDAFFGEGNKTLSLGKGQMFEFIDEDQGVFAPDLDEKLTTLKDSYLQMKKLSPVLQTEMAVKTEGFKMPEMKLPDFSMFEKLAARFSEKTQGETKKETVQKIEGSGTININVNISSSGDLASSLMSDRRFKNDLETEILNTMKNKDLLMVQKP
jgi:hypothetical protein